jgi:hypothetical protein
MQTGGNHTVKIIHCGPERFRRKDNLPYPKGSDKQHPQYLIHEEKPIPFSYNPDGLSWDPVKNTFTPGKLFQGTAGSEDGDLGFPQPGANVDKSVYAPIGPFGKWRVEVNPNDNKDLNWDKVKAIVIDFHVFMEDFDKRLVLAAGAGTDEQ